MLAGRQPMVEQRMKAGLRKMRVMALAAVALFLLHTAAQADRVWPPPKPRFPQQQITAEQLQAEFEKMKADPTAGVPISPPRLPGTTMMLVGAEWSGIYYFTKPESPAHPAMLFARIETDRKHGYVNLEGYFAGSQEAFATWFDAIEKMTREVYDDTDTIVTIQKWE
jgi:hypothetical protein